MAALPTTYSAGIASINQGETVVTGQGTSWLSSGIQAGDLFWAAGLSVRIASVESNTSLTLAYGWPGANRAGGQYEVRYTPDGLRALATSIAVNNAIGSGNLYSFGGLQTSADKLAYATGAGTWSLIDFKSVARQFLTKNYMPVQQGTGIGQQANEIKLGLASEGPLRLKATVDLTDLGMVWTDYGLSKNLSESGYFKLPNGIIVQWLRTTLDVADQYKLFPITFPGTCFAAQASVVGNAPTTDTTFALTVDGLSVAGFNLRGRYAAGGAVGPQVGLVASILALGI